MKASFGGLTIRPLSSLMDYEACTELQEEVWGHGFSERVSAAILMIANRLGGLAAGAFDSRGVLQGFVFGLTGVVDGELIHWSDMLAVRPGNRDLGLGTRLKWYQREVLLQLGVRVMQWTFDPLQGRNAFVNLRKLGIVCREYVENMYGETDSPLHQGVGTDRLVALWRMDSERVSRRSPGADQEAQDRIEPTLSTEYGEKEGGALPRVLSATMKGDSPVPGIPSLGSSHDRLLLAVPSDVERIMESDMPLAVRWRTATRQAFIHYLSRGYEVTEFLRGGSVSFYLLEVSSAEDP